MAGAKLTAKQELFVAAYCSNGFNATQAARDAGYSSHTVKAIGGENLTKPVIAEAIKAYKDRIAETHGVTVESLMKELEEARGIALSCATPQVSAAISATMGKAKLTGLDQKIAGDGEEAKPLTVSFNISSPVKDVRVTKGK